MEEISIFALGGQDENGKNAYVIEIDRDLYVINFGNKVPINSHIGIDGIIPDAQWLIERQDRIKGVFITHAHDEAFGAMPWYLMDVKSTNIYGSAFTVEIVKDRINRYKIGHSSYEFHVLDKPTKIGKITVEPFEVATSVPGALGFSFKTKLGSIIFMSKFIIDKIPPFGETNLEKIKEDNPKVFTLLTDARHVNKDGHSKDNKSIGHTLETIFEKTKNGKRIIVGAFDEEVFTLSEIIKYATKYERPVAIYGRAFAKLFDTLFTLNNIKPLPKFIDHKTIKDHKNAVVLVTGIWSRLYKRFVRIATNNDVFLKLKPTDAIVSIMPPVNGMEVEYNAMLDDVAKTSPNIIEISENDYSTFSPYKEDIFMANKILKPEYYIPTSGLYRYLVEATMQAHRAGIPKHKTLVLQNGKIASFVNGKLASQKGTVIHGDVVVDGFGAGDISYEVIKERRLMAAGGFVSILQNVNWKTKVLIGKPTIQFVGIGTKEQTNELREVIKNIVIQKVNEQDTFSYRELQNIIRKRTRKVVSKLTNKEPLVIVSFYDI